MTAPDELEKWRKAQIIREAMTKCDLRWGLLDHADIEGIERLVDALEVANVRFPK